MSDLWYRTRDALLDELGTSSFTDSLRALTPSREEGGRLVLQAPDEMSALIIEKNYRHLIERGLHAMGGHGLSVEITFGDLEAPSDTVHAAEIGAGQMGLFAGEEAAAFDLRAPSSAKSETSRTNGEKRSTNGAAARINGEEQRTNGVERRSAGEDAWGPSAGGSSARSGATQTVTPPPSLRSSVQHARLVPDLCFSSFVVGSSNQFAHEAAKAVAENPGTLYNPLLLFGGVGLGKTHLMNAVGIEFLRKNPGARVRYLSAETFVNELIAAIGSKQMDQFRQRNRIDVDLLLIDDIQFIAGKERTQEEFFHTFNALHQASRQIVLTSDRFPQEMPELEERLKSRLGMGLVADIQPPELETRIAILQQRAQTLGFHLPIDVLTFIAEQVSSNVRDLHGALTRLGTWAKLRQVPITLELARDQLAPVLAERELIITPERILEESAEAFGVRGAELKGRSRVVRIALPRKVAMYLAKKYTDASYPELGRFFGGRDHTTVLSGCRWVEAALKDDGELRARVDRIEKRVRAGAGAHKR